GGDRQRVARPGAERLDAAGDLRAGRPRAARGAGCAADAGSRRTQLAGVGAAPTPDAAVAGERQAELVAGGDAVDAGQRAAAGGRQDFDGRRGIDIARVAPELTVLVVTPGPHRTVGAEGNAEIAAGRRGVDPRQESDAVLTDDAPRRRFKVAGRAEAELA